MCQYTGMRYPLTAKSKSAFSPNGKVVVKQTNKFTTAAVTLFDDNITNGEMDLNRQLVTHPSSTFFVKVKGTSMKLTGVFPNDILIVDRSVDPYNQAIVLATLNGEFILKSYIKESDQIKLYSDIEEVSCKSNSDEFEVWGVVVYVIHGMGGNK